MKNKSGAARRLVSLVLALGLIFALVPASAFASNDPLANNGVTAYNEDSTVPDADGTVPNTDGTVPNTDGTVPNTDGTVPNTDGTVPNTDGTVPNTDGTVPNTDGTVPNTDGTVPNAGNDPAVEQKSSPVVMNKAPQGNDHGISFIFDSKSSDGVQLWYATRRVISGVSELKELPRGEALGFAMLAGRAVYFYVYIPAGYELDELNISSSENNYEALPMTQGYRLDEFAQRQQEAMNKGCTYGFYFSGTGDWTNTTITVTTKPIVTTYTVDKSANFDSSGAYFVEELPAAVREGESLSLTLYGPNDAGVTQLIQTMTVLDGATEKNLTLPLNGDDEPTINYLDGATIKVQYEGIELVQGLLRTKYSIELSNVQGEITFNTIQSRKWVEKAVNVNELEGIAALEYCGTDNNWQSVNISEVTGGSSVQVPFYTRSVKDIILGHYQIVNFRFKLQDGYTDYNLALTKKNGTIDKGELVPDADGWYHFSITIGAVLSGDDIEVWFGDDTYQVDMRLTAEKTTTTTYPAKFYVHEAGSNDYYPVGVGTVDFGEPTWAYEDHPIDLSKPENLAKVLTAPQPENFGPITVGNVEYTYSTTAGEPNTYTFEGWEVGKVAWIDDTQSNLEWHVDGIIVLHKAQPVLPESMQPKVIGVNTVYDGTEHKIEIEYKESSHKNLFEVTYQTKATEQDEWSEPTTTAPAYTDVVDPTFYVKVTFTDRTGQYAPYVVGDDITGEDAVRFVILPRPVVLTVSNETITEGQADPAFTLTPSAKPGDADSGLLEGHTVQNGWTVTVKSRNVGQKNVVELNTNSVRFVDENGDPLNNPTPTPARRPRPCPSPR